MPMGRGAVMNTTDGHGDLAVAFWTEAIERELPLMVDNDMECIFDFAYLVRGDVYECPAL